VLSASGGTPGTVPAEFSCADMLSQRLAITLVFRRQICQRDVSFGDAAIMHLMASTHAMARDSCALPVQNIWLPLVWQESQAEFRSSTGMFESFVKRTAIVSFPPPASTCALPGPWQASQPSFSCEVLGCTIMALPIVVCSKLFCWSA